MNTAETILSQLGGRKFIIMTGSSNFLASNNSLSMKLTRNASKANYLKITLNGNDLYDLEFISFRGMKRTIKKQFTNIYCDQLVSIFESSTGLYTSL